MLEDRTEDGSGEPHFRCSVSDPLPESMTSDAERLGLSLFNNNSYRQFVFSHIRVVRPNGVEYPLGRDLFTTKTWQVIGKSLKLSVRETQVVVGIFSDQKEQAIAHDLEISRYTVNTYLQRVYAKLGVRSRAQLIVRVVAQYLLLASHVAKASSQPTPVETPK